MTPPTKPPSRTEIRIALGLTAVLLAGIVLVNAFVLNPKGFDFSTTYVGGLILRKGSAHKLYDLKEQARIERKAFGRRNLLVILHPPFEILFFAPLTILSYRFAYALWGIINVFLWLLFQHLVRPFAPVPKHPFHYLMLCLLFFPLWAALLQGQTSILLLVLFCLAFIYSERRQDYRAGFFLGLGLFRFPIVLPFALICFLRSKWRLILGFVTAGSVLAALSLAAVGPSGVFSYAKMLIDALANNANLAYATIKTSDMPTLRGFLTALMASRVGAKWIEGLAAAGGAVLAIITASLWRRNERRQGRSVSGLMFAAALTLSLVITPYLYVHDLTPALLALLLVLGAPQRLTKTFWSRAATWCAVILCIFPLYLLLLRYSSLFLLFPVLFCLAVAALFLAEDPLENQLHGRLLEGQNLSLDSEIGGQAEYRQNPTGATPAP